MEGARTPGDAPAVPHIVGDDGMAPVTTFEGLVQRKKRYDDAHAAMQARIAELWGPEEAYEKGDEDYATIFEEMYYGWVEGRVRAAAEERLTSDMLPPPTRETRSHECGLVLSRALQAGMYARGAWSVFLGADVVSRLDASSKGVLRWVGVPQQGGYSKMMAAVEWSVPPSVRVAEHSADTEHSPFFNGVVHGETLFIPERADVCTLELTGDIDLALAPRGSELGQTISTPQRLALTRRVFSALPYFFFMQFPYVIVSDISILLFPVVLEKYVAYLGDVHRTWSFGLFLVVSLCLLQLVRTITVHRFFFLGVKCGLQYRASLIGVIFEKCFLIAPRSLALPEMSAGRIINMVSTDVEMISQFTQYAMHLWSSPFIVAVSIALLARLVGWCSLMAVVALIVTIPLNAVVMKEMMKARKGLVKATDERVKVTNEFLSGVRIAKFMTWEPRFIANIEAKRAVEISFLKQVQRYRVLMSAINVTTPLIMVGLVFVIFFLSGNELTPTVVFPTISLLGIIRQPFEIIPIVFGQFIQFMVSMTRITKFLECDNTSCSNVEDIVSEHFQTHTKHNLACQLAVALEYVDVVAFVPVKLPRAPQIKMSMVAKGLRMVSCCEACRPKKTHPPLDAVDEDADAEASQSPGSPTSESGGKPAGGAVSQDARYQLEPRTLLQDVTLQVPAGKLTLVLGATGCGKSTLLQTLLGQFEISRGHAWASKSIAYVPQQPWIMNATLRGNILFFDEDDPERVAEAVRVSQMEMDLQLLASGLETEIGEKGVNLSGGQKARVSLARAVYANREMYLLDDPLSALDAHVGERIVTDCILGKLEGKTRVLATHQLHIVPRADHIILLGEHRVLFNGSRADFVESAQYRDMMGLAAAHESESVEVAGDKDEDADGGAETEPLLDAGRAGKAKDDGKDAGGGGGGGDAETDGVLMTKEEKASGSVPLSTYLDYFQFCGGRAVAAVVLVVFLVTELLSMSSTVWLSVWSTRRFGFADGTYLLWYVILVLCGTVSAPLRYHLCYTAMRRGSVSMHKALIRSIATGTMGFFDTTPLGRILNRFSRDIDVADNGLQNSMTELLAAFMSIVVSNGISIASQPFVIFAVAPCSYVYYRIMVFYKAATREIRRTSSVTKSPLFSLLGEVLSGAFTVTAYGKSGAIMTEVFRRLDLMYSCFHLEFTANRWLGTRIEVLGGVIVSGVALVGVIGVMTSVFGGDIGLVSLSLTMALQSTGDLTWLVREVAAVEADMNSVERIIYYATQIDREDMPELKAEVEMIEKRLGADNAKADADAVVVEGAPGSLTFSAQHVVSAGSLEFRDVALRYREGLPLVLNGVSFRIARREKVGIVGRTGSGKSTLLLTFMRMVDTCGGEIVVNGSPILSFPLRELRRQFSMIPQDPVLFDGTVRLNVDPFLEASSEEVWHALELCGLRERIASEAEGIDSRVQEGGSNYSVGQRQLLCMARALLKKGSGFILMDEATANIDHTLDKYIQGTVMKAFAEYTVITIAHRLQTVAQYDKIIVMDKGKVAEVGSPRELVSDRNSVFRGMVEAMGREKVKLFVEAVDAPMMIVNSTSLRG